MTSIISLYDYDRGPKDINITVIKKGNNLKIKGLTFLFSKKFNIYEAEKFRIMLLKNVIKNYKAGKQSIKIFHKEVDLRIAQLLIYAIYQIIFIGPTYFTEFIENKFGYFIDPGDCSVPPLSEWINYDHKIN